MRFVRSLWLPFEARWLKMFKEEWVRFSEDEPEGGDYYIAVDLAGFEKLTRKEQKIQDWTTRQSLLSRLIPTVGILTTLFMGDGALTRQQPKYFRQLETTDQLAWELKKELQSKL